MITPDNIAKMQRMVLRAGILGTFIGLCSLMVHMFSTLDLVSPQNLAPVLKSLHLKFVPCIIALFLAIALDVVGCFLRHRHTLLNGHSIELRMKADFLFYVFLDQQNCDAIV